MRKFLSIAIVSMFATNFAFAQAPAAESGSCEARALSKEGKPLYGAAKAAFMKKCNRETNGQPAQTEPEAKSKGGAQQEKMKTCNAEAKSAGKKGDERKAFMKECLSK